MPPTLHDGEHDDHIKHAHLGDVCLLPADNCALCGQSLDVTGVEGYEDIEPVTRRFGGGTWKVHGWCAVIVDREAKQCGPDEHDWPAELDGSECNRCGQDYDTWTVEENA